MSRREDLPTERTLEASRELDTLGVAQGFDVFDAEDRRLADAVHAAKPEIVKAIELAVEQLGGGGRLIYVGAGTSGRLGVLDAVECPPTFRTEPSMVQGRLAGGESALTRSVEGAEDSFEEGGDAVADVGTQDLVFGIAAGGTTPFVHGALARARELGAATVFLACVPRADAPDEADVSIRLDTGPEVLAGSTRLKAATATKMVLNRVTTLAFARLGKVYDNLMVDVEARGNRKLLERAVGLVRRLTDVSSEEAHALLERADGSVKVACVMQAQGVEREEALRRLAEAGGHLREALARGPSDRG